MNLDELKQETEIRARRAQAEARQSASDEARLQRAEAAAPRDENGEPILELSPGGAPAPAEVQAYAPGGSGPELSQEELESRNIKLQVKTPSVKVNIKV